MAFSTLVCRTRFLVNANVTSRFIQFPLYRSIAYTLIARNRAKPKDIVTRNDENDNAVSTTVRTGQCGTYILGLLSYKYIK